MVCPGFAKESNDVPFPEQKTLLIRKRVHPLLSCSLLTGVLTFATVVAKVLCSCCCFDSYCTCLYPCGYH